MKIMKTRTNKVLIQVGATAKKIAIGGANVLSNISGEVKKRFSILN
jgi:hypothetical protein